MDSRQLRAVLDNVGAATLVQSMDAVSPLGSVIAIVPVREAPTERLFM